MKKVILFLVAILLCLPAFTQANESKISINADLVSRYVWRGTQINTSMAVQPSVTYSTGGFTLGTWAHYCMNGTAEFNLFATFTTNFGLGFAVNDYFIPSEATGYDNSYFNFDDNHVLEIGLTYATGGLSLAAYRYMNHDESIYMETNYAFNNVTLFVGAGDNSFTESGEFNVVNMGFRVSKEGVISEKLSVTPFASIIVNPNREQAFLVVGVTL